MTMPAGDRFRDSGAGCTQRCDVKDGTILAPMHFRPPGRNARVTAATYHFDGHSLCFKEHGMELAIDDETRGLLEPSLTRFANVASLRCKRSLVRDEPSLVVVRDERRLLLLNCVVVDLSSVARSPGSGAECGRPGFPSPVRVFL